MLLQCSPYDQIVISLFYCVNSTIILGIFKMIGGQVWWNTSTKYEVRVLEGVGLLTSGHKSRSRSHDRVQITNLPSPALVSTYNGS